MLTALVAMLLINCLQFMSRRGWAPSNLVALLRWTLCTYRDLWQWVNDPFNTPPGPARAHQTPLPFGGAERPQQRANSPGRGLV